MAATRFFPSAPSAPRARSGSHARRRNGHAAPAPTPAPEPPKSPVTMKDGRLSVPGNIVYETGKAIIKPESEPTLAALKDFMDQNKNFTRVRIEGHTDNVGKSPGQPEALAGSRAQPSCSGCQSRREGRCLAVGFGDAKPIANNAADDGRAQNRRTEFHIAEIDTKPFLNRDENRRRNDGAWTDGPASSEAEEVGRRRPAYFFHSFHSTQRVDVCPRVS